MTMLGHQESLEIKSGAWLLQKKKHYYYNLNSYQPWSNTLLNIYIKRCFGPIFFFLGNSHTKGSLVQLHPALEGITEGDTDPKERFVSFKVTPLPLITKFSVFMLLQGIVLGNSCLGCVFLKDYEIIWKIKMREMKTK